MSKYHVLIGGLSALSLIATAAPAIAREQPTTTVLDPSGPTVLAQRQIPPGQNPVTSVDELSDIQPGIWYYDAIANLVEKYRCVAGYPDGTFRPQRSISRAEMAVLLNNCLEAVAINQEDIETIKALQEEFAAELATLRGRVDGLEAQVKTLESQQFSTTTKLSGQVILAGQFGDFTSNSTNLIPTPDADTLGTGTPGITNVDPGDSRASALARVRLSFNTSFSGSDLLETTLETGNGGSDFFSAAGLAGPSNFFPVPPIVGLGTATTLGDAGVADFTGSGPDVTLYRLGYTFEPIEDLSLTFGPIIFPSDFIDGNSYANDEAEDFSSGFFINNPLIIAEAVDGPGGAGGAFDWKINGGPLSIRGLFIAADAGIAAGNAANTCQLDVDDDGIGDGQGCTGGLVGDPYQASAELEYASSFGGNADNNFAIRLQYTHSSTYNVTQNIVGVNAEATFGRFGVFGRYGISLDPRLGVSGVGNDIDLFANVPTVGTGSTIQTWMAGIGVKDLMIEGSLLGFAAGQPFIINSEQAAYSTQTNFEAFYKIPVNDNISVTPVVMLITNPFNIDSGALGQSDNTLIQGVLRATFSF